MKLADESPHFETPLEWWFFQGFFEGSQIDKNYFMLSLFRQKIKKDPPEKDKQVFYLICSNLDLKKNVSHSISQIHRDVLKNLNETFLLLQEESGNLDPVLFQAYMKEIKTYGPPSPIKVISDPVDLKGKPLTIRWGDFSLVQKSQAFHLSFKAPSSQKFIQLKLIPQQKVIHLHDRDLPNLETTCYNTYPRMNLSGKINSLTVKGNAWMDHQWGDFNNWFIEKLDEKRYLGWDWIGINLNDGSDMVVTAHRDMESNKLIKQGGLYRPIGSPSRALNDIIMEPTGFWESPHSHIIYPIQWKITIPELKAQLHFTPFHQDQEIPFFGVIRAIWEGAGEVRGSIDGQDISGRARLELHGYGYLFDYKKHLQAFSQKIDRVIESFLPKKIKSSHMEQFAGKPLWKHDPEALTSVLSEPVWDLISRKGKRWRPVFGLLALESLGVDPKPYETLICSTLELNHTGALIIDDIEDKSLIRRGEKCLHLKYGKDVAINAGCILYFLPTLLIQNNSLLNEDQKRKLLEITNQTMIQAHFGQAMDIYWSKYLTKDHYKTWSEDSLEDKILQMYAQKTGAAVVGGSEAACVIAKSSDQVRQRYRAMAAAFGTAFQIIDDIHNFSKSPEWTKKPGEDISSGKLTYVIHRAIQCLENKESEILLSILCSKKRRKEPEQLAAATDLIYNSGVLALCKKEAADMIDKEWKKLSRVIPMTEAKIQIKLMITGLLNFNYET
ncbi:MAG: hypothetical protein GF421_13320 [Candidatus Aminicenantes bacterium]|nr:hypothetical protein [Candidatus Aminicenantes bacterium]